MNNGSDLILDSNPVPTTRHESGMEKMRESKQIQPPSGDLREPRLKRTSQSCVGDDGTAKRPL